MSKLNIALTIAGTDPTGGAGIMADLKSFQAREVYGMAVVTSVVAQNTLGVQMIRNLDLDILEAQLKSVFDDITPNSIKTGMIANADMMKLIKKYLPKDVPYVVDPVMVATSGDKLIDDVARKHLKEEILPLATIITPNVPEAEEIVDFKIVTEPVLVITGSEDKMVHPNIAKATAKRYKDATLTILQGSDHMYEAPKYRDKTVEAIEKWLISNKLN